METATLPETITPTYVDSDAERSFRRGYVAAVRSCLAGLNQGKETCDLEAWLSALKTWQTNPDAVAPPRLVDPLSRTSETRRQRRRRLRNRADGCHAALLAADALAGCVADPKSTILPQRLSHYVAAGMAAIGEHAFADELARIASERFGIDGADLPNFIDWAVSE